MELSFVHFIGLAALAAGSYTDLKTREVPDWLNYGLMIFGIGFALIASLVMADFTIFARSIGGFLMFVALGLLMFYAGQWGGGDSKLIMGLGALIGLEFSFGKPFLGLLINSFLPAFLVNLILAGVVYGLLWAVYLAIKNRTKFSKAFTLLLKKFRLVRLALLAAMILAIVSFFLIGNFIIKIYTLTLILLPIITFYLWVFAKAIEASCMLKLVEPERLTEGDWIAKDIVISGKRITGPKDLGISKAQIAKLTKLKREKRVGKILIKEGIPFVPSFLIAFVVTILYDGWFIALIHDF